MAKKAAEKPSEDKLANLLKDGVNGNEEAAENCKSRGDGRGHREHTAQANAYRHIAKEMGVSLTD